VPTPADANDLLDRHHENLAVADLAGTGRLDDGLDGGIDVLGIDDDLDLDLGQEIDHILGTAIEFGMALLAPEALDLGDGQAGDTHFRERFAHFVEFERLDDGFDFLHVRFLLIRFLKFVAVAIGNRIPPILAKATRRNANANRRLAPLVFGDAQQADDTAHRLLRQTGGDDLTRAAVLFHVGRTMASSTS
jgi:hypothetical protein